MFVDKDLFVVKGAEGNWREEFNKQQRRRSRKFKTSSASQTMNSSSEQGFAEHGKLMSSVMLKYQENLYIRDKGKEKAYNRYGLNRTVVYAPSHLTHVQNTVHINWDR
ncbi:uncharacterized protein LOC111714386 [Eurytemora carolleeae]|uniref:uncharacterized protein LOC111714386 n=1 Tax=Eurytemora carolleeae TaxID=1294199 RepID=UPI000C764600|nr:uncharacterized protein LOC111714386 [Eurytemora carolleeae]|eukprot:XP_023345252.1 uncharacterized protein LOC111714386 [Eurytemora affinis]